MDCMAESKLNKREVHSVVRQMGGGSKYVPWKVKRSVVAQMMQKVSGSSN